MNDNLLKQPRVQTELIMSIFEELHPRPSFVSWEDHRELIRALARLAENNVIKEISPSSDAQSSWDEKWFVECCTGVVYRLRPPDPPDRGDWSEVVFPPKKAT